MSRQHLLHIQALLSRMPRKAYHLKAKYVASPKTPKQDSNKHKQHGGRDLGYQGEQASQMFNNNLSVNANPGTALEKVNKEISLNRIAGPFKDVSLPHFNCSPLALREKSTPGQWPVPSPS